MFHADESQNRKKKRKKERQNLLSNTIVACYAKIRSNELERTLPRPILKFTEETIRISIVRVWLGNTILSLSWPDARDNRKNSSRTNNREHIALMHIHIHTRGSWKIEPEEEFRSKRETTYLSLTRHDLAGGTPSRERLFDRKHTRETVFDGNISTIYVSVPKFTACPRQLSCTCVCVCVCVCMCDFI